MKEDIKGRSIFYLNIALAVALLVILIIILKPLFFVSKESNVGEVQPKNLFAVPAKPAESAVYDIDKIKKAAGWPKEAEREFSDFKEMYENSNKWDAGGNMVEAWSRVKPEDKARLTEGFDREIASAQETLKVNPENKHAKNLLYISETLKKMAADGFNYKFKNKE